MSTDPTFEYRVRAILNIKPHVIQCERGGWLAVSKRGEPLCIRAIGTTAEGARKSFELALKERARSEDPRG